MCGEPVCAAQNPCVTSSEISVQWSPLINCGRTLPEDTTFILHLILAVVHLETSYCCPHSVVQPNTVSQCTVCLMLRAGNEEEQRLGTIVPGRGRCECCGLSWLGRLGPTVFIFKEKVAMLPNGLKWGLHDIMLQSFSSSVLESLWRNYFSSAAVSRALLQTPGYACAPRFTCLFVYSSTQWTKFSLLWWRYEVSPLALLRLAHNSNPLFLQNKFASWLIGNNISLIVQYIAENISDFF